MPVLVSENPVGRDHFGSWGVAPKVLLFNNFTFTKPRELPPFQLLNLAIPKGGVYALCGEHAERLPGVLMGRETGNAGGTILINGRPLFGCSPEERTRAMTIGHPEGHALPARSVPLVFLLGTHVTLEAVQIYEVLGHTILLCADQPGDAFRLAHRVFVLKDGFISEAGSYDRLVSRRGLFSQLNNNNSKFVDISKPMLPLYQQRTHVERPYEE
ncbi:MAG: hypothetical protein QNK37_10495 [Acidobacteriota bacterium]|nr:hypothetical protein [Acidobacteriota bacterium]